MHHSKTNRFYLNSWRLIKDVKLIMYNLLSKRKQRSSEMDVFIYNFNRMILYHLTKLKLNTFNLKPLKNVFENVRFTISSLNTV